MGKNCKVYGNPVNECVVNVMLAFCTADMPGRVERFMITR